MSYGPAGCSGLCSSEREEWKQQTGTALSKSLALVVIREMVVSARRCAVQ